MTLIRSNPSYKTQRSAYLFEKTNFTGKTREEVLEIFKKVDLMANAINERTGGHIPAEELYLWVIGWINDGDERIIKTIDFSSVYRDMEEIFLSHPPVLYAEDTLGALENIRREASDSSFSILSNTAFIKGSTLRKILPPLGLGDFFDFQLYSDEAGMSKPNQAFFRQMLDEIHKLRGRLDPGDIIHIGDNPLADVQGASKAGIAQLLVNSNQLSIASLCETP
jgi:putative hydrolase of the HAD superfamily